MIISLGIYKKSLLFWLGVLVVALGIFSLLRRYGIIGADFTPTPDQSGRLTVDIVVQENGRMLLNGEPTRSGIIPSKTVDRFLFKVLDQSPHDFQDVTIAVHLPKPVQSQLLNARGLLIHSLTNKVDIIYPDQQTIVFQTEGVAAMAIFSIVFELPKGYLSLSPDLLIQSFLTTTPFLVWLGAGLLFPLLTLIFLILQLYKRLHFIIKLRQAPLLDKLPLPTPPAVVGALLHGVISPREIAATLIDLAVKRRLTIFAKGDDDFTFAKTPLEPSHNFEKVLLSKLFYEEQTFSRRTDVLYRVGHRVFSEKMAVVYLEIYEQLERDGYFLEPPAKVILRWRSLGVLLFFIGLAGFFTGVIYFPEPKFPLFLWLGVIVGSLLIERFAFLMSSFSAKGMYTLAAWIGFKKYLTLPEPASYQEAIDGRITRYLPYAIIFGVEDRWLARFLQHPFSPPNWFDSSQAVITIERFSDAIVPVTGYVARLLAQARAPTI